MYVDDVIIWGRNVWELMDHFSWVVEKLMEVGLFVEAHKVTLYARELTFFLFLIFLSLPGIEPATYSSLVVRPNHWTTESRE